LLSEISSTACAQGIDRQLGPYCGGSTKKKSCCTANSGNPHKTRLHPTQFSQTHQLSNLPLLRFRRYLAEIDTFFSIREHLLPTRKKLDYAAFETP
jgi:hypothetical protein